jgi:hypothetical protein
LKSYSVWTYTPTSPHSCEPPLPPLVQHACRSLFAS